MNEELLRLKVEPFIHYTVEQIKINYGINEAKEKMLFASWWLNFADKSKDAPTLISEFDKYCSMEIEVEEIKEPEKEIINPIIN